MKQLRLLVIALLLFFQPAVAQTITPEVITVSVKDAKIIPILKNITKQSGYRFVYDKSLEKSTNTVSVDFKHGSLTDALKLLESTTSLKFKVSGKFITVTDPRGIWIKTAATKP